MYIFSGGFILKTGLLQKLTVPQLIKEFPPTLWNPKIHRPPLVPTRNNTNPFYTSIVNYLPVVMTQHHRTLQSSIILTVAPLQPQFPHDTQGIQKVRNVCAYNPRSCLTFRNLASYIQDGCKITLQMPHFIFIQQISVLNILNMLYNLHFFSSKCRLFHNATLFGFCVTHILNTECAKI